MDLTKVLLLVGCAVVASTYFTYANFTSAFPMLSLELKMSKAEAQDAAVAARVLATFESRPFLGLEQDGEGGGKTPAYMSAASFGGDDEVQHYIELAGGGNEAFKSMIARVGDAEKGRGWYSPYRWTVRHFLPNDKSETVYSFSPAGAPLGFTTVIPETEHNNNTLSAAEAQRLAERAAAAAPWLLSDIGAKGSGKAFELIEGSDTVQLGGRVDHTFVYERVHERISSSSSSLASTDSQASSGDSAMAAAEDGRCALLSTRSRGL